MKIVLKEKFNGFTSATTMADIIWLLTKGLLNDGEVQTEIRALLRSHCND